MQYSIDFLFYQAHFSTDDILNFLAKLYSKCSLKSYEGA